jgi:hypothetical protein
MGRDGPRWAVVGRDGQNGALGVRAALFHPAMSRNVPQWSFAATMSRNETLLCNGPLRPQCPAMLIYVIEIILWMVYSGIDNTKKTGQYTRPSLTIEHKENATC